MAITVALAGDTMLGRGVAERLSEVPPASLVSDEVVEFTRDADVFVLNLECCISDRGSPWPAPGKPFFFRAPPSSIELLVHLGVDCVTLANNHALDFGVDALLDTVDHLRTAGIPTVGAGHDESAARSPVILTANGFRLAVLGFTDHPAEYAADEHGPGVSFADLRRGVPDWIVDSIGAQEADAVVVTPHWGPNMTSEPVPHVRAAASVLAGSGATLVAGHSAHVFHGIEGRVLFDIGDFLDDYAVDGSLRNDLGILPMVTLDEQGPIRMEALPLHLEYCFTRVAVGAEAAWIRHRLQDASGEFGTDVREEDGRLVVEWRS